MQITVDYIELKQKLELVARVSTKHLTLPILQCVLIEVKDDVLFLRATNLEVGIECRVSGVQIKKEGIVAVPATTLLQIISLSEQKEVTLTTHENTLSIETKSSKTNLNTIETGEFPNIPKIKINKQKLNGKIFSLGIKSVAFAVSQSSIKPELGSVYIYQKKEHSLTFVATDSFRLMEKTTAQQNVILEDSFLLPQKNALELSHVCELVEEDPEVYIDENQCALSFDSGIYITSRLTNGTFPDYEQIIPKEYSTHTTLLTKDLELSLKKTNIFLNKFMQLSLTTKKTSLILNAQSGEVGEATETIPATTEGDELTLSFNQRYINEVLTHISDESITLNFAGIGRPLVLKGVHDNTMRYLVMPMNK